MLDLRDSEMPDRTDQDSLKKQAVAPKQQAHIIRFMGS